MAKNALRRVRDNREAQRICAFAAWDPVMDTTKKNCPEWIFSFVVSAAEPVAGTWSAQTGADTRVDRKPFVAESADIGLSVVGCRFARITCETKRNLKS